MFVCLSVCMCANYFFQSHQNISIGTSMEAYDSEKGFKLCSKEIGQFYWTLLAEKTDPGRKNGRKNTFFDSFSIDWAC